jgi:FkbM family methyltransferase
LSYHEENDLKLFLLLAKESKTIVDIGSNTGVYSVLSSKASPSSNIYAVEPYPANIKRFNKNLELNNIQNVKLFPVALGEEIGSIKMTVPESDRITDASSVNSEFSQGIYPELKWKQIDVDLVTLDSLIDKIGNKIDLIKCDVETYEMSVFKGSEKILREHKPTILFESFLDEKRKIFFNEVIKNNGYYLYLVLKDGLVRLDNGFDTYGSGLNFLISPRKSLDNFVDYKSLEENPGQLLSIA